MSAQFIAGKEVQGKEKCIVAVDLGYSKKERSCGFCTSENGATGLEFGKMVKEVSKILNASKDPLLVIEAPLSTYHNDRGNPDIRFDAERGHGWYCHAGAEVLLGALRLLKQLSIMSHSSQEIRIAEAFFTQENGKKKDPEVAKLIVEKFEKSTPVKTKEPREQICDLIDKAPNIYDFGNL